MWNSKIIIVWGHYRKLALPWCLWTQPEPFADSNESADSGLRNTGLSYITLCSFGYPVDFTAIPACILPVTALPRAHHYLPAPPLFSISCEWGVNLALFLFVLKDTVVTNDRWGNGCACKHGGYFTCADRWVDAGQRCFFICCAVGYSLAILSLWSSAPSFGFLHQTVPARRWRYSTEAYKRGRVATFYLLCREHQSGF